MPNGAHGKACGSLARVSSARGREKSILSSGGPMIGKRNIGSVAAIGGMSAAFALLTGLPAASADELADLRANQELLQKRIDQLSQAAPVIKGPGVAPAMG